MAKRRTRHSFDKGKFLFAKLGGKNKCKACYWIKRQSLMMSARALSFKPVQGATIGAKRIAICFYRQVHAGMCTPVHMPGHGTVQREIGIADFYYALGIELGFAHRFGFR